MRSRPAIGSFIDVPSGAVHVRVDGPADGPVVVLLHGFASSMHAFDRVAALLAVDHRVIRLDLLGHGFSPRVAPDYGSDAQAAMVAPVLDRLGVRAGMVVGHSFGADVAIALAELDGRVGRLVVIGQAPDYSSARLPRGSSLLSHPTMGRALARMTPAFAVNRIARFAFAPGVRPQLLFDHPGRIAQDSRATSASMSRTVLIERGRSLAQRGLDQRLRDLGLPALVILGARDQLYPVGPTSARYATVPGARVEVLAASGHSPVLEEPAEVARLISAFAAARESADG